LRCRTRQLPELCAGNRRHNLFRRCIFDTKFGNSLAEPQNNDTIHNLEDIGQVM
jgi:hypothetical protein